MAYGGLATIFKEHKYFICDEVEEYAQKAVEIIEQNKKSNFDEITVKYTNMEMWKKKIEKVYQL